MSTSITVTKPGKSQLAEQISFTDEQVQLMKDTVAKGATTNEFMLFMHLAQHYGLDPFLKEIWCLKYASNQPATVFTSRDGYLKIASRDPQMDGIQSDVVREGDVLEKRPDGSVSQTYGNPRGAILGAFALVWRKDRSHPAYFYAPLNEYNTGNNPTWKKYPSAMIVKVAEAMALKRAFSISGLVTQEELGLEVDAAEELATGAMVLSEPKVEAPAPSAAVAKVNAEPITPRTKKLILLAVEVYDCEPAKGEGAESRLLDSLESMSEPLGQQTLRWLEKQPKKKAKPAGKTAAARTPTPAVNTDLTNEFRDHPTTDDRSPVEYATTAQKDEIDRLCAMPVITRAEKVVLLLNINRLDTYRADDAIAKLTKAIAERENAPMVAA
jgi:phage recombination protein Bet